MNDDLPDYKREWNLTEKQADKIMNDRNAWRSFVKEHTRGLLSRDEL